MATYKVIQDIEAEDHLIGALSMRQFIYAAIVAVSGFLAFKLAFTPAWWLIFFMLPHMILFAILAAPFGHDQSSEVWLLAKIRFFLKPRRRVWDQSGTKELVTITAPKKIERQLTNNLTQTEVKSRLQALADTIDSRGWAVKNVNVNLYTAPTYAYSPAGSDRLLDQNMLPQDVPTIDVQGVNDMMDINQNPTAQKLDEMISASEQAHRQQVVSMMQDGGDSSNTTPQATGQNPRPDFWFMNDTSGQTPATPPGFATFDHNPLVAPGAIGAGSSAPVAQPTSEEEAALLQHIHQEKSRPNPMHSHLKTILPLEEQRRLAKQKAAKAKKAQAKQQAEAKKQAMTPQADPAILNLANNNDLNVATLARQANKIREAELADDEVVISLH
jgi:hypothetical protein